MRCSCADCNGGKKNLRRDFRQGGVDIEDFEEPKHKKASRSNFNHKMDRACKKSKTKEACIFTGTKVIGTRKVKPYDSEEYINAPYTIKVCARCGKYSWGMGYIGFV